MGSGGNGNIKNIYSNKHKDYDYILIYIDVVPDNTDTMKKYRNLKSWSRNKENVLIILMICSEYNLLRAFTRYEDDVWRTLREVKSETLNIGIPELEMLYKYLLSHMGECLQTDIGVADINTGRYYIKDCDCCNTSYIHRYTLSEKVIEIIKTLPIKIRTVNKDSILRACFDVTDIEVLFDR